MTGYVSPSEYFGAIIWPHGLDYLREILSEIDLETDGIVQVVKLEIEDLDTFVEKVYEHDFTPKEHLSGKTSYLRKLSGEIACVFFKINSPAMRYFGEGRFKHLESIEVRQLKTSIRKRFNPVESNGEISHDHIIHFTDSFEQTFYLDKYLVQSSKKDSVYSWDPINYLGWPMHQSLTSFKYLMLQLDDIYANLIDENGTQVLSRITETPHYFFCKGDHTLYETYIQENLGFGITEFRSSDKYLRQIQDWQKKSVNEFQIDVQIHDGKYRISDGLHRAAFLKANGEELCQFRLLEN